MQCHDAEPQGGMGGGTVLWLGHVEAVQVEYAVLRTPVFEPVTGTSQTAGVGGRYEYLYILLCSPHHLGRQTGLFQTSTGTLWVRAGLQYDHDFTQL